MKAAILVAAAAALAVVGQRHARQVYHRVRSVATASAPSAAGAKPLDPTLIPPTIVGMNLSPLVPWSQEEPFLDPLKNHGTIAIGDNSKPLKDVVKLDADGWPLDLPLGTRLTASVGSAHAVMEPLSCSVSPGWRVDGAISGVVAQNGTHFTLSLLKGWTVDNVLLILTATTPGASLTELACRPRNAPENTLFRADFLHDIKPFRILRFIDWMKSNDEPPGTWATRPTPRRLSGDEIGMPVEYMVELANLNHSDPWFVMPFHADVDYQRRFATYVRDHLAPGRKVYVELSNEVWNNAFPQGREATALGKIRYPGADEGQQNDYFYGDRVRAMMAIWSDVFAGQTPRLVRVLSNMSVWAQRGDQALGHGETWRSVDALAIAPYFGDVPVDIPGKGRQRVDGIIAKTPAYIEKAMAGAKENKLVAAKYGLRVITYEGGPGYWAYEPTMVQDVRDASHDPRLYDLYSGFLTRWRKEIGGELVLFNSANDGIYGHLDRTGQPWNETPKMRAVIDFIAKLPDKGGGKP